MTQNYGRLAITLALLLGAGWYLQARERGEVIPARHPFASFPNQLGPWEGTAIPIDKDTLNVLKPTDVLLRQYEDEGSVPPVGLFAVYYASQRSGEAPHSPMNCLPGSGWRQLSHRTVTVAFPGEAHFPANEYVIEKGLDRQLVLYWFPAHGRAVASEYQAKISLVLDAMRLNRSDGAMIRLSTSMTSGESTEDAMKRLQAFGNLAIPQLNSYIPK